MWNTGPALSLDRLGLDLLNNRFNRPAGSFASQGSLETERRVEMKTGLAIVSLRHMAHQAQDFALLVDDDRSVLLGPKIKPADLDFGERADGRD